MLAVQGAECGLPFMPCCRSWHRNKFPGVSVDWLAHLGATQVPPANCPSNRHVPSNPVSFPWIDFTSTCLSLPPHPRRLRTSSSKGGSFRFSKSSALYIVMRYGNIIEEGISLAYSFWPGAPLLFCKVWYYIGEWVAYCLFIPTTIFLGLRTYALFREKGIAYKWSIISLVVAMNCISFVAISIATRDTKFSPIPIPNLTCQFNIIAPPYATGVIQFSICAVFDFGIFILTAYRVYEHYKMGNRRLTLLLFKDSLLYYCVLFCGEIAMLLLYILLPKGHIEFRALLITPLKCMCVIIVSRIVLNIRKLLLHPKALTIDSLITPPEAAMYNATATDVLSGAMAGIFAEEETIPNEEYELASITKREIRQWVHGAVGILDNRDRVQIQSDVWGRGGKWCRDQPRMGRSYISVFGCEENPIGVDSKLPELPALYPGVAFSRVGGFLDIGFGYRCASMNWLHLFLLLGTAFLVSAGGLESDNCSDSGEQVLMSLCASRINVDRKGYSKNGWN
ncbi:hypothetical protein ARMGADRAFT_1168104 [Armillaria gallica]|uniref:Uncharacterized protein n=1 Tax=Armillaria gallica TaxID=47427 RepID=A0A2H3CZI1_ARMGA|nr:hypothetical protein ARMGADRAFT_1168104 [Armillaria gallica]